MCGSLLLFLRINNIMLFFCLLSLECYIEKEERMAWKQRKKRSKICTR